MKNIAYYLIIALNVPLAAQEMPASAKVELDAYYGNWGAIYYPRIKWKLKVPGGTLNGFGFVYRDRNPGPWFSNHPLVFTPNRAWWLSARVEVGGVGKDVKVGQSTHQYFFQVGPQVNFLKPKTGTPRYCMVSFLPHMGGIRPHNFVTAFATSEMKLVPGVVFYFESYQRMFPERGIKRTFGEAWVWIRPKAWKRVQFAPLVRLNSGKLMFAVGSRITFSL